MNFCVFDSVEESKLCYANVCFCPKMYIQIECVKDRVCVYTDWNAGRDMS